MKQRLIEYLAYRRIGQTRFEKMCGLSNGTINNIKAGLSSVSLQKVTTACPDLNPQWLLTGEGSMLQPSPPSVVGDGSVGTVVGNGNRVEAAAGGGADVSAAVVAQYEKRIEELQEQNRFLKELVVNLTQKGN